MIIGISGKKQSGKDEVAKMVQYFTDPYATSDKLTYEEWKDENDGIEEEHEKTASPFEIKKFADKLKDITCLLIGCSRKELEDEEFKNTPLGSEWDCWSYYDCGNSFNIKGNVKTPQWPPLLSVEEEEGMLEGHARKMTPRLLLQLLGTECGRQIIHPNIWVNSTMADHRTNFEAKNSEEWGKDLENHWIISDVRFPNEVEAIEKKKGLNIRVERYCYDSPEDFLVCNPDKTISLSATGLIERDGKNLSKVLDIFAKDNGYIPLKDQHESETALDDYRQFDYTINNVSSIENLLIQVENILKKERII